MNAQWRSELLRLLAAVGASLAAGLALGAPFLALAVALAAYLLWHLHQAYKLARWLRSGEPEAHPPPGTRGVWRPICRQAESRNRTRAAHNAQQQGPLDR